ncbi:MAG: PAS domain S-box protein [Pirellulales bacterium]
MRLQSKPSERPPRTSARDWQVLCESLQASVEDSECRYRQLIEGLPAATYTCDAEGRVTLFNEAAVELWGRTPELGKDLWCGSWRIYRVNGTPLPLDQCPMAIALREGRTVTGEEIVIERPDGTRRNVLPHPQPIRDLSGRVVGGFNMLVDITERKCDEAKLFATQEDHSRRMADAIEAARDRKALHESEERFARFMQHFPGLAWIKDSSGRYVFANEAAQKAFQKAAEELYGKTDNELFAAKTAIQFTANDQQALSSDAGIQTIETLEHDDGVVHYSLVNKFPIPGVEGQAALIGGMAIDVTDRKRAEESLRESEERFRRMADHAPVMIWVTEADGHCSFLGKTWYDFTGRTPEESLGFDWIEAMHPNDRAAARETFLAANERQEEFRHEYRLLSKDGSYHWMIDAAAPRLGDDGTFLGYIGSVIDISNRKKMEEVLRESQAALLEADRRKDEFLALLAHELRNPLAPIRTGLELLRLAGDDRSVIEEVRLTMDRQSQQMVRLIDDLLDVSRITRGTVELRTGRVELAWIMESAVETARPVIEEMGHKMTVRLPNRPVVLEADPTRLAQVISNLLNNAAKYMKRGGSIDLNAEQHGGSVVISVKDRGIGIPAEMIDRIFDMFIQVDGSLDRSHGGLGIGLTLVKRLVEMHGGTVEARSDGPDRGSEFIVRLPVVLGLLKETNNLDGQKIAATSKRRILVVDDNENAAQMLGMLLKALGNDVRMVFDGLSAIKLAAEFRPDVVLLDIGMPQIDGYETARLIRQEPWGSTLVLAALTGWGQEDDKRRTREAGFDHHFVKPVEPAVLQKFLADCKAATS